MFYNSSYRIGINLKIQNIYVKNFEEVYQTSERKSNFMKYYAM